MSPTEVELALFLVKQVRETIARLKQLKTGNPAVYAEIGKHVDDALAEAKAELAG